MLKYMTELLVEALCGLYMCTHCIGLAGEPPCCLCLEYMASTSGMASYQQLSADQLLSWPLLLQTSYLHSRSRCLHEA